MGANGGGTGRQCFSQKMRKAPAKRQARGKKASEGRPGKIGFAANRAEKAHCCNAAISRWGVG